MRMETWVSLAVCLLGAAVPLAWVGPQLPERPGLLLAAGVAAVPFAVVAATAWLVRADRRAARGVAAVAALVLAVGLGGWVWAARDRDESALALTGMLLVPGAQLMVWLGGAVVSGRRAGPTEPPAGWPSPALGSGLGVASLSWGLVACFGAGMILLADLGWISRAVKLGGLTQVVVGVCWLFAVLGGSIAALGWWSRSGCLAAVMCLVFAVGLFVLLVQFGGGWLD